MGLLLFGTEGTQAYASENTTEEFEMQFDITEDEPQEVTFVKENGEEVTMSVEPVPEVESAFSTLATHYFPYGTSTYKVSATSGYMGMSFYIKVNVPQSNTSGSSITSAYDKANWVIGGYLSDESLTRPSSKSAKYTANVIWLGGMGSATCWLKASLSNNVLTTTAEM